MLLLLHIPGSDTLHTQPTSTVQHWFRMRMSDWQVCNAMIVGQWYRLEEQNHLTESDSR
jgi:hypothetical protein